MSPHAHLVGQRVRHGIPRLASLATRIVSSVTLCTRSTRLVVAVPTPPSLRLAPAEEASMSDSRTAIVRSGVRAVSATPCIGGADHYWSPPVKSSLYKATVQSCARCGRIRRAGRRESSDG